MSRTVLVVDDDAGIRELLRLKLERNGFDVELSSSGQACVSRLETDPTPDLVLLDVMMPRMSGFEVLEWIRTEFEGSLPVVLLTGTQPPDDVDTAEGAMDYITKPFRIEEVLQCAQAAFDAE